MSKRRDHAGFVSAGEFQQLLPGAQHGRLTEGAAGAHSKRANRSSTPIIVSLLLLSACAAVAARGQEVSGDQRVGAGRTLAIKICSACHLVSADQPFAPILRRPGPEFRTIANRPNTTAQSLHAFISTTHTTVTAPFNVPSPELTDEMTENVVSYILSLRSRP
jgi:cytochrome c1